MIMRLILFCAVLLILCPLAKTADKKKGADPGMAIRAGKLITVDKDDTVINGALILVKGTVIEAIGKESELKIPKGYKVIDASNYWVTPGMVDYHSHVGAAMADVNDAVYLTNAGLRMDECFKPNNEFLKDATAAGITSMLIIPGSSNNMSGFGVMFKNDGRNLEESTLTNPGCAKMAQAGNPERWWWGPGRTFQNWNLRYMLEVAKSYHEKWCAYEEGKTKEKPDFSLSFDQYRSLFKGEIPTCLHTQFYQVCMASFLMMHDHFGFWTVPTHSTFDAYKLAPLAKDRGICIIAGPRNVFYDRAEGRLNGVCAKWAEGGVTLLGTETDSIGIPGYGATMEEHFFQGALASRMGWKPYPALRGVTIVPAQGGMVENRVGSIEVGKDADFTVWDGDPLDPFNPCLMTICNGKVIYDIKNGQRL